MGAVKRTHPDARKRQYAKRMVRRLKQSFAAAMGWDWRKMTFELRK